jgi:3-oxoacyl-[acyl-carrier protein] reductase
MTIQNPLDGKVALVTGASGGIGSVICQQLAAAGARIVFTDVKPLAEIEVDAAALPGAGHLARQAFVDDSAMLAELAADVEQHFGRLDILVNCAGITFPVPHDDLDALTDEMIDKIMRVNVRGVFACTRAFKPLLAAGEGGLVVNISSIAGQTAVGSNVAYCASKAAVNNMTMALARALAPAIRVVAVSPGWVMGEYAKRMLPEVIDTQRALTPLDRLAGPADVAQAVLAVATHLTFTTGCVIPVDGGRPLT